MNIRRKASGIAFTATLLSALVATVAAPLAFASVTVTSAGTVPRGGTSANPAIFNLLENSPGCFGVTPVFAGGPPITGYVSIQITDTAGGSTVHFVAPPSTAGSSGTLGAVATLQTTVASNDTLTVELTGQAPAQLERIVASAKISADAGAPDGAIKANFIVKPPASNAGSTDQRGCVLSGTTTATGTLANDPNPAPATPGTYEVGSTTFVVNLTSTCAFRNNIGGGADPNAGGLVFATNAETKNVSAATAPAGGQQTLTTVATVNPHNVGEAVSQTVSNCSSALASPGTVGSALTETAPGTPPVVNVGENNQGPTLTVVLSEAPSAAPRTLVGTQTFTITTAGVLFSAPPTVTPSALVDLGGGPGVAVPCSLSLDRKSCSVTIVSNTEPTAPVTGTQSLTLSGIFVDTDATAVPGAAVKIVASQGSTPVTVTSSTVAFVGSVLIAVAAQPTIYIGFNDQVSGMITITEATAGYFSAGPGPTNNITICYLSGEVLTRAPWIVRTSGDLLLLNPATVTGVTQIQGALVTIAGNSCATWFVFTASTVASTFEIRGSADGTTPLASGANNGPRLSVPNGLAPGSSQAVILIGPGIPVTPAGGRLVSNAIRAFKNSVTVTAASQPNCPPGTLDCLLGNIVITETQNGQFKAGDVIRGYFLPDSKSLRNDVLIKAGNTNDLPIITTNAASGLLVSPVVVICPPNIPLLNICFFAFGITQQSFGPTLGQVTISNIHATIAKDATLGPIQMDWGNTALILGIPVGTPIGQPFETVVSNGNVGSGPVPPATTKTSATSAVTKTVNPAAFSVSTKVVTVVASSNNIVTIRIKVDPALVGKSVVIQRATKNSAGVWSSFTNLTSRVIGADGYAYYFASAHSAQWNSYRGKFLGNAQWAPSQSQTVQVHWI